MGIEVDHVDIILSAPPKYSPVRIAEVLKSISSKEEFKGFPALETFEGMGIL